MNPLMRFTLAYPEQPPLHHLEGVGLQVDQDKQQPILGGRQGTVRIGGIAAGSAQHAIEASAGHMGLEGGLKGRD
jgi:hypothetical protein